MPLTTGQDVQQYIHNAQANVWYNNKWNEKQAQKQMDYQTESNAKAMAFSAAESQKNRDFQERMSNTSHQREVQDLVKAGLNPVLSAHQGATTPAGNTASGVSSSGAKAEADTSLTGIFGSMLSAIINQATALQTTSMNNTTSLEMTAMTNEVAKIVSQIGAAAQIGTANINATTQRDVKKQQIDWEREAKQKYPSNPVSAGASILQKFIDTWNNNSSSKSYKDKIDKWKQKQKDKPSSVW